nr:MAG TPA: hypothetical protein [Caudoviricetes sp.]
MGVNQEYKNSLLIYSRLELMWLLNCRGFIILMFLFLQYYFR